MHTALGAQTADGWNVPPPPSQVLWSTIVQNEKIITPSQQPPARPGGGTHPPDASHTAPPPTPVPLAILRQAIEEGALLHPVAKSQHTPALAGVCVGVGTGPPGQAAGARHSLNFVMCCGLPFWTPPFGHSPQ